MKTNENRDIPRIPNKSGNSQENDNFWPFKNILPETKKKRVPSTEYDWTEDDDYRGNKYEYTGKWDKIIEH